MSRRYWIEHDDTTGPDVRDIEDANLPTVRVFADSPPFALGEVVAFFVGDDREQNAERFVAAMEAYKVFEEARR